MITTHDVDAAIVRWVEAECHRLGGPPSDAEIAAYGRGELSAADAARVRALLVYYPHLNTYLQQPARRTPLAPMLAITVAAVLAVMLARSPRVEPHVWQSPITLTPPLARGPSHGPPRELPADRENYDLELELHSTAATAAIDIVDADGDVRWSATGFHVDGDRVQMTVPSSLLDAGEAYRIAVFDEQRTKSLGTFRVMKRK
jgi:hypothetical protein